MSQPWSTTSRASLKRARGVRAALAWDTKTSRVVKRFLDSSTPRPEVFAHQAHSDRVVTRSRPTCPVSTPRSVGVASPVVAPLSSRVDPRSYLVPGRRWHGPGQPLGQAPPQPVVGVDLEASVEGAPGERPVARLPGTEGDDRRGVGDLARGRTAQQ